MATNTLAQSHLRDILHYDPGTGVFAWKVSRGKAVAGSVAGYVDNKGYRRITIDSKRFMAHRLAWLYMTGSFPPDQIDHRNLVKDDNSFDNLRPATGSQNRRNCRAVGASKYKGACLLPSGRWQSSARHDGRLHHLGTHATEQDAANAYATFAKKHFPEFMRLL